MAGPDRSLSQLRRHLRQLTALHHVQTRVAATLDPDAVLATMLASLDQLIAYRTAAVYLLDDGEPRAPRLCGGRAYDASPLPDSLGSPAADGSLVHQALAADRSAASRSADDSATLTVLLRAGGQILGAIDLRLPEPLPPDEVTVVELLAAGVAGALHNARLHQEARRLATTDGLTGLSNRRAFDVSLDLEVRRARRLGYSLGLVMLDLDHFKQVNDRHGHAVGDDALRRLGALLRGRLRGTDVVGRLGGEEFAAVLPGTGLAGVGQVAEALRQTVAHMPPARGGGYDGETAITVSLGGAAAPAPLVDAALLLARADQALYQAKRDGGNQVRLWRGRDA